MTIIEDKIIVHDLSCMTCTKIIEKEIGKLNGVLYVKADYYKGSIDVKYDCNLCDLEQIKEVVKNEGYSTEKTQRWVDIAGIITIFAAVIFLGIVAHGFDLSAKLTENVSYFVIFGIGLFVSIHCIGMCGGLMLSQTLLTKGNDKLAAIVPSLSYNVGRIISYTVLGGIAGAIGSLVFVSPSFKAGVTLFAGLFVILMGLNIVGLSPFNRISIKLPWAPYATHNRSTAPFIVGLFNGLLPCGPLQTMQLYALSTGSAVNGATVMFIFALGTVPIMLAFGSISGFLSKSFTKKLVKISGILVIVLGLIMVNKGLAIAGTHPGCEKSSTVKMEQSANIVKAEIKDGVQTLKMVANKHGYVPKVLYVQKGIPVRWVIDGQQITSCNNKIIMPSLNIEKALQQGENVIEFTPSEVEAINFSCWMDMIRGVIYVVDDLNVVDASQSEPIPALNGSGAKKH